MAGLAPLRRLGAAGAGAGGGGVSLAPGLTLPGTVSGAPDGTGGAPFSPGTGSVLAFGSVIGCGSAVGATLAGTAPGVPGLAVNLIDALGGSGALPCWISAARWVAAAGRLGPGPACCPDAAAAAAAAGLPGGAAGGGWLMTLLMTVVLWMLLKMTSFDGGAT